jgi:hypothetical protein
MKKLLVLVGALFTSTVSNAYENAIPLEKLKNNQNMEKFVNSTYFLYTLSNSEFGTFTGIAVAPNIILTAAHNIEALKIDSSYMKLRHMIVSNHNNENIAKFEGNKELYENINGFLVAGNKSASGYTLNADIGYIVFNKAIFKNHLELATDVEVDEKKIHTMLITSGHTIFAIGISENKAQEMLPGYATKMSGADYFNLDKTMTPVTNKIAPMLIALDKTDANGDQINALQGDSGGPWVICDSKNDTNNPCRLIGIQSFRNLKNPKYTGTSYAEPASKLANLETVDASDGNWK